MMKKCMFTILFGLCTLLLFAEYPSVVFGAGIKPFMSSETLLPSEILLATVVDARLSMRSLLGDIGYFSLLAGGNAGFLFDSATYFLDEEVVSCEAGFNIGDSRIVLQGGIESSLQGTLVDNPFFEPNWQLKYTFSTKRDELQPYVSAAGNWRMHSADNEDVFFLGAETGFQYSPDALTEYTLRLGGGWENWYEYYLYNFGGGYSIQTRQDFVGAASAKISSLFDFFLQWELECEALLRISDANRYITALLFYEEMSENNINVIMTATGNFSVNKYVNIKLVPAVGVQYYFMRQALAAGSVLLDENVYVIHAGGLVHFDWTSNNSIYFIIELEGSRDFSNDAESDQWMLKGYIGIKGML
ncbi:MAG: hypothetical protein JW904_01000 [Spirochaetales bacterium]|nr:hypothetical protein [Spirochaetales bacterium]